jgi:hypothetical protein
MVEDEFSYMIMLLKSKEEIIEVFKGQMHSTFTIFWSQLSLIVLLFILSPVNTEKPSVLLLVYWTAGRKEAPKETQDIESAIPYNNWDVHADKYQLTKANYTPKCAKTCNEKTRVPELFTNEPFREKYLIFWNEWLEKKISFQHVTEKNIPRTT